MPKFKAEKSVHGAPVSPILPVIFFMISLTKDYLRKIVGLTI